MADGVIPEMKPSARDRIDMVYEQWNDVTDIGTDIEDLHIAAMEQAYRDGWNTARAEKPNESESVTDG